MQDISLHVPESTNSAAGFSDLHNRIRRLQRRLDVDTASIADSSLDGSSLTQTEHHFALKRFLLDTETVFDDVPESSERNTPAPLGEESEETTFAQTLLTNLSLQPPSELAADSDRFPLPRKENTAPFLQHKLSASSQTLTETPFQNLIELGADSGKSLSQEEEQIVPYPQHTAPFQEPYELSVENDKNLSQGKEDVALHPRSTLFDTLETLASPSRQERIDLGANSGRSISLEKMLRLADPKLLETRAAQDNILGSQVCFSNGACIIPEIVAAVEGFEPSVKDLELSSLSFLEFYTFIGGDSRVPVSQIRSAHLYGIQSHFLTVPCLPGDTQFFEAVYDFEARRLSDLSFKRGDIIRKDQQTYQHWAQGSLGKRTGLYPENHVRPCSFRSLQSCILSSALKGRPLINEMSSRHLFTASGRLRCTKPSVYFSLIVCF